MSAKVRLKVWALAAGAACVAVCAALLAENRSEGNYQERDVSRRDEHRTLQVEFDTSVKAETPLRTLKVNADAHVLSSEVRADPGSHWEIDPEWKYRDPSVSFFGLQGAFDDAKQYAPYFHGTAIENGRGPRPVPAYSWQLQGKYTVKGIDIDVDANLDGVVDDNDDPGDMEPGGLISAEFIGTPASRRGRLPLARLNIVNPGGPGNGIIAMDGSGGWSSKIKLWRRIGSAWRELSLPATWMENAPKAAERMPDELRVEPLALSDSPRDITLNVTYRGAGADSDDQVALTVAKLDLDIDANYNGVIEDEADDDPVETTKGGIVLLGETIPVKLKSLPAGLEAAGYLSLRALKGGDCVRVWTSGAPDTRRAITLPAKWTPGAAAAAGGMPDELLVEGIKASATLRDVTLSLAIIPESGPAALEDTVTLSVINLDLDIDADSNGTINDKDDPLEMTQGGLVPLNTDDDNGDGTADRENGPEEKRGDDELRVITLKAEPVIAGGVVTLEDAGGASTAYTKIRLWRRLASGAMSQIVMPVTWRMDARGDAGMPAKLYVEGIDSSSAWRDVNLRLRLTATDISAEDTIALTVTGVDLDIDSDNTNGLEWCDRSLAEEMMEDKAGNPGKFIVVNKNDDDGNGVPNFADGFRSDAPGAPPPTGTGGHLVPLTLELARPIAPAVALVRFKYPASDPTKIEKVTRDGKIIHILPADGGLRVWRVDGTAPRGPKNVLDGGDFVTPSPGVGTDSVYHMADFFPATLADRTTCTLYVESVKPSAAMGDQRILVEVDPDGAEGPLGWILADAVRDSSFTCSLNLDMNNDGEIDVDDSDKQNPGVEMAVGDIVNSVLTFKAPEGSYVPNFPAGDTSTWDGQIGVYFDTGEGLSNDIIQNMPLWNRPTMSFCLAATAPSVSDDTGVKIIYSVYPKDKPDSYTSDWVKIKKINPAPLNISIVEGNNPDNATVEVGGLTKISLTAAGKIQEPVLKTAIGEISSTLKINGKAVSKGTTSDNILKVYTDNNNKPGSLFNGGDHFPKLGETRNLWISGLAEGIGVKIEYSAKVVKNNSKNGTADYFKSDEITVDVSGKVYLGLDVDMNGTISAEDDAKKLNIGGVLVAGGNRIKIRFEANFDNIVNVSLNPPLTPGGGFEIFTNRTGTKPPFSLSDSKAWKSISANSNRKYREAYLGALGTVADGTALTLTLSQKVNGVETSNDSIKVTVTNSIRVGEFKAVRKPYLATESGTFLTVNAKKNVKFNLEIMSKQNGGAGDANFYSKDGKTNLGKTRTYTGTGTVDSTTVHIKGVAESTVPEDLTLVVKDANQKELYKLPFIVYSSYVSSFNKTVSQHKDTSAACKKCDNQSGVPHPHDHRQNNAQAKPTPCDHIHFDSECRHCAMYCLRACLSAKYGGTQDSYQNVDNGKKQTVEQGHGVGLRLTDGRDQVNKLHTPGYEVEVNDKGPFSYAEIYQWMFENDGLIIGFLNTNIGHYAIAKSIEWNNSKGEIAPPTISIMDPGEEHTSLPYNGFHTVYKRIMK